ncbi:LysE family translocator [uncultured Cohaesibacter sp.]|uniref:LysE family translocator n=1 Tax=uncultured Cohaesibacter sp. TaxID=1002546 RepID=UPI0029C90EA3|nr:LysE family translocator [uncultured Cohaesibacter sp.]
MEVETWALFALAILVASISPGPNVLIVIIKAARFGTFGAIWTILGNLSCLFGVALLASFGVGAMIATAPTAYTIMKIAGGVYMAWLGIKIFRSSFGAMRRLNVEYQDAALHEVSRFTLFFEAVAVSASNPKSIIFLSAVFPQFLDISSPMVPQFALMFVTIIGIVSIIHGTYAYMAISMRKNELSVGLRKWFARLTGTTFIGLGIGVAFSK